jgi:glycine dehydrogenase subunit 2
MLIFELSQPGRKSHSQMPVMARADDIPESFLRGDAPLLPQCSEMDVVRHYTRPSTPSSIRSARAP